MDFGNPWLLLSGLFIGLIGMAMFIYGKKQQNLRCLSVGVVLCVYPYFIASVAVLWLIAAACLGGLYAWSRFADA